MVSLKILKTMTSAIYLIYLLIVKFQIPRFPTRFVKIMQILSQSSEKFYCSKLSVYFWSNWHKMALLKASFYMKTKFWKLDKFLWIDKNFERVDAWNKIILSRNH